MKRYNLTGTQNFWGQKDAKTYYNVKSQAVWKGFEYMCETFNLPVIFVYDATNNEYVGSYSRKYKNFTDYQRIRHVTYNF